MLAAVKSSSVKRAILFSDGAEPFKAIPAEYKAQPPDDAVAKV
jgi:hypothetical protein